MKHRKSEWEALNNPMQMEKVAENTEMNLYKVNLKRKAEEKMDAMSPAERDRYIFTKEYRMIFL